jgi:hypothetical protein
MKIAEVKLEHSENGKEVVLELQHGLSSGNNFIADKDWVGFNARQLEILHKRVEDGEDLEDLLEEASFEDLHWRWLTKGRALNSSEYEWFYLVNGESIEGICVVYHPKMSRIDSQQIFYIDYLATAPWNRDNLISKKIFKGVGTTLIKHSLRYSVETLKYRPGFGLHSLPKAIPYYKKIGMLGFGKDEDKQNLHYFEMSPQVSVTLL